MASRGKLGVIFFTVFLDMLGFGLVIPILPLYAKNMHATNREIGWLMAIYSLMQLFFAPIWGRLSDRAGRRPVLLISIIGSCGSQLGYAFAPSFFYLVLARAFAGICGANISAAQAYIADVTEEKDRAAGMGMLGAALGLGFVFGPAAGGTLSHVSARLPFLIAGALAGVNFLLALMILSEPRAPGERTRARTLTWEGLISAVTTPRLLAPLILFFVVTFGFANLEGTFSLFLKGRFDWDSKKVSYMFCGIGVLIVLVQGGLVRRLVPRLGERRLIIWGTALMAVGFLLQAYAMRTSLLFVAVAVMSIGNGLNAPSLSSLISRSVSGDHQGGVLGVSQSLGALARVVGPLAGTFVLDYGLGVPYVVGGLTMAAACIFAVSAIRQPT